MEDMKDNTTLKSYYKKVYTKVGLNSYHHVKMFDPNYISINGRDIRNLKKGDLTKKEIEKLLIKLDSLLEE